MAPRKKKDCRPKAPDGRPYERGELLCAALAMQAPLGTMSLEKLVVYIYEADFRAAKEHAAKTGDTSLWYELHSQSWTLMICGLLGQRPGTDELIKQHRTPHPDPLNKRSHRARMKAFKKVCGGNGITHFTLPEPPNV